VKSVVFRSKSFGEGEGVPPAGDGATLSGAGGGGAFSPERPSRRGVSEKTDSGEPRPKPEAQAGPAADAAARSSGRRRRFVRR
jgi:hypothetical protein